MEQVWVPLTLITAFSLATSDAFAKKALAYHDEYLIAWLRLALALPVLFLSLLFAPLPPLDRDFFVASFTSLPFEIIAMVLYIKALKISPLSLTLPFLSLTPVFLIVVPYLLLGEKVSAAGAAGVLLIAAGSYTLNLKEFRKGVFEPFLAIRKERGSLYMILVALIFSFTSTLGKKAIGHSSPVFFGTFYYTVVVLVFAPLAMRRPGVRMREIVSSGALKASLIPGICHSVMIITHMIAVSMTKVAYMISVKRLSLLIGVLYGHLLFREPGLGERLAGTALMLAGFALIVLSR